MVCVKKKKTPWLCGFLRFAITKNDMTIIFSGCLVLTGMKHSFLRKNLDFHKKLHCRFGGFDQNFIHLL